jgi:hypothetical protein
MDALPAYMRKRLIWLLPGVQVIFGLLLGYWGSILTFREAKGAVIYDYISWPELILHVVNLPPAALICAITRNGTFQIGIEHSIGAFAVYLCLIFAVWFILGWRLSTKQLDRLPSGLVKPLGALGTAFGLFLILVGIIMLQGPMSLLLTSSAFIWGAVMIVLFGPLIRNRQARRVAQHPS